MKSAQNEAVGRSATMNRIAYAGFIMLAVGEYFLSSDLTQIVGSLGIALVFDPFAASGAWQNRKRWQKMWLIVHLLVLIIAFIGIFLR